VGKLGGSNESYWDAGLGTAVDFAAEIPDLTSTGKGIELWCQNHRTAVCSAIRILGRLARQMVEVD
jgi:hypothetical protein